MSSINLQLHFQVPRAVIYEALVDPMKVMQYTRARAQMIPQENKSFSMLDGKIVGKFIKLRKNEYIKMQWKFNDWTQYSTVQIILQDPEEDQCDLILNHTQIPKNQKKQKIQAGWRNHILQPMSIILGYPMKD